MSKYLITGANRGIGLELCHQLKKRGDEIIGTCRRSSDNLDSIGIKIESGIDISSESCLHDLSNRLEGTTIDCLILNAAIAASVSLESLNSNIIREQFEVNALSQLNIVKIMLKNLTRGSKIIIITSRMGSIADNTSGGSYGYRMSKAALCMAGKSLSIDLRNEGISVGLLHPGLVRTRMTGFTEHGISTTESVKGLIKRIDMLNIENSGTFWHANGEILPW